jgi:ABC-type branched-subunit amino acid transport system substrate-binding protein
LSDPKSHPWTIGITPTYSVEAQLYAKHVLATRPDAKIAVLFQNDDFGKDYLSGFKEGLGARSGQVVAQASYEFTDPTVDSQIVELKASGADVFLNVSTAKFAAQAIRKMHDIGWKPLHYAVGSAAGIKAVLVPAGVDISIGIVTAATGKDPNDAQWNDDDGMKDYRAFMKKYYPAGDPNDLNNAGGYSWAMLLVQVLRACGDDLTRDNVMRQATTLKEVRLPLSLPGAVGSTAPDDYRLIKMLQMRRFDGQRFVPISDLIRIGGQP